MAKQVKYNVEARDALKRGVDILANAVKVTLGPQGRTVIIDKKFGSPAITKDGVTVAKEIELKDPIENMGAQMVKEVASKTADIAGDGTTTATVLAQAIIKAGVKNVASGANPMDLKRGIDKAVKMIVENLKSQKQDVGDDFSKIKQVASISANNDDVIGEMIADAMKKVRFNLTATKTDPIHGKIKIHKFVFFVCSIFVQSDSVDICNFKKMNLWIFRPNALRR